MAFTGLVSSEYSTGASHSRGGITKTGNAYLRRILVEAAWHYRHRPGHKAQPVRKGRPVRKVLQDRQDPPVRKGALGSKDLRVHKV